MEAWLRSFFLIMASFYYYDATITDWKSCGARGHKLVRSVMATVVKAPFASNKQRDNGERRFP